MFRILIILIFAFAYFSVSAQNERKLHVWNYNKVSVDITSKTSISASEKIQYTPFEDGLNSKFGDVFFNHKTSNWVEYSGGFRVLYSRGANGWITEQRPMILGTFTKEIRKFEIDFLPRFEYRIFEHLENHFRLRQRLDIKSPSLTSFGLQLFTAEETYTKFNQDRTHLARLYAGIQTVDLEHFAMKLYYGLEKNKKNANWNTADILGMNLSFRL